MRILFISNLFPDQSEPYRGLDNAVVLKHLANSADVSVKSLALRPRLTFTLIGRDLDLSPRLGDEELHPEYHAIPYIPKAGGAFNARLAARYLKIALQPILKNYNPTVILTSWLFPDAAATVMACKGLGLAIPTVMIAQGSDVHRYLRSSTRRRQILDSIASSNVHKVITRSRKLGELLVEAGASPLKVNTIYNGVDMGIFYPPNDDRKPRPTIPHYLTVGNLLPVKNQGMLIESLALVNRKRNSEGLAPAKLSIVGKGPLRGNLETLAQRLGQNNCVHFTGPLPADKVADRMRSADHFCMTSLNEGFPNVLLEAMACALPITSTDVGGIAELLHNYPLGQLVPSTNVEAMAQAMSALHTSTCHQPIANSPVRDWTDVSHDYALVLEQANP